MTVNNYEFEIYQNGNVKKVFDASSLTIGAPINIDKYGYHVKNYTVTTNEFTSGIWRLFYQDKNYTYLIVDEAINLNLPTEYPDNINGSSVSIVGQKLNSKISNLFTAQNTDKKIKTTAWLTDTSMQGTWIDYRNDDTVFAIGSPTLELYVASYNNASKTKENDIIIDTGSYGYTQNTERGWIKFGDQDNHGIYTYRTTYVRNWWLSSPTNEKTKNSYYVVGCNPGAGCLAPNYIGGNFNGIRPIVCIPTDIFNSKYVSNLLDE